MRQHEAAKCRQCNILHAVDTAPSWFSMNKVPVFEPFEAVGQFVVLPKCYIEDWREPCAPDTLDPQSKVT